VQFSNEEAFAGMTSAGMFAAIASMYVEMGTAIKSGIPFEDFEAHKPQVWGKIKLTGFADEFAVVYNSQS
jgi:hypothetical protein